MVISELWSVALDELKSSGCSNTARPIWLDDGSNVAVASVVEMRRLRTPTMPRRL
ncbi:hypothetical protein M6B38_258490 [Iris pallida]|uniref:Uncharacterized protein n=1 Tax=Iris pallida TaxID=29817 RepID=A0AAX6IF77_IRIPA|nr:hypothetical protein M6B38_258490 [Iris pallida]